jgi:N-acetylglucosaminyl-diphospho-decaprenol L-rhamnosyltransferase
MSDARGWHPRPLDPAGDVSVVIVAYRTPDILAECLASFERHRPRRVVELIVIDNGQTPEAQAANVRFPWIKYVPNERNVHFRRGVNQGARLARSPYLLLLNPDAYLTDPESIGLMAAVLDRDRSVGMVGPKIRGDDGHLAPQGERIPGIGWLLAQTLYLNAIWPDNPLRRRHTRAGSSREVSGPVETVAAAALLCRREEFLVAGGFDENVVAYWEEAELARKLRRRGLHAYYLADALIFHHWHRGGTLLEPEQEKRHWHEAMRAYYARSYGFPGRMLFDGLTATQGILRRAVRGRR